METLSDYRTSWSMEHERQLAIDAERSRIASERAATARPAPARRHRPFLARLIGTLRSGS